MIAPLCSTPLPEDALATLTARLVPLDAVHDALLGGPRQDWRQACERLARLGILRPEDAERARLLRAFGQLIANTDMHSGNLAFFVESVHPPRLALAPAYDMLPMQYRPGLHGEDLGPTPFTVPSPGMEELAVWPRAKALAQETWRRVAKAPECSAGFRAVCEENARRVLEG